MQIGPFKFIDTASFMPESLEDLAKFLKEKGESQFIMTNTLAENKKSKYDILTGKGIYPYEYDTDKENVL